MRILTLVFLVACGGTDTILGLGGDDPKKPGADDSDRTILLGQFDDAGAPDAVLTGYDAAMDEPDAFTGFSEPDAALDAELVEAQDAAEPPTCDLPAQVQWDCMRWVCVSGGALAIVDDDDEQLWEPGHPNWDFLTTTMSQWCRYGGCQDGIVSVLTKPDGEYTLGTGACFRCTGGVVTPLTCP